MASGATWSPKILFLRGWSPFGSSTKAREAKGNATSQFDLLPPCACNRHIGYRIRSDIRDIEAALTRTIQNNSITAHVKGIGIPMEQPAQRKQESGQYEQAFEQLRHEGEGNDTETCARILRISMDSLPRACRPAPFLCVRGGEKEGGPTFFGRASACRGRRRHEQTTRWRSWEIRPSALRRPDIAAKHPWGWWGGCTWSPWREIIRARRRG